MTAPAICPICLSRKMYYAFSVEQCRLVECRDCGHMMLHPPPSRETLDRIYSQDYWLLDGDDEERRHFAELKRATAREYLELVRRCLGKHEGRLLEIGSGAGDLLAEALNPETRSQAGFGFIGGPVGGVLGDVGRTALSPLRHDLFDAGGRRVTSGPWNDTFQTLRRWTPETWYTKLAVDRLFYDQLQTLLDPHYRESFRRAEQYASRRGGGGYWWAPGEATPPALQ